MTKVSFCEGRSQDSNVSHSGSCNEGKEAFYSIQAYSTDLSYISVY
jgi:hypothetical protein